MLLAKERRREGNKKKNPELKQRAKNKINKEISTIKKSERKRR